ncbi:MAG TPA: hypothetical protein VFN31_02675 [Candidatus Saccharimonadales bacterium]|nr:hypothetical protein [Candidatus Saccharimonadales bacterium]
MDRSYWRKQDPNTPLFPDLIWSRPEHKAQAGKLLIVGGHVQSFAAVASAYSAASDARIGVARVMLPDVLQKTLKNIFIGGEYLTSTPSGSIARLALEQALASAEWADGVLLAGDFGRNSETAIFLEQLVRNYKGPLAITKDGMDYFSAQPEVLLHRENTLLIVSLAQLQKIASSAHWTNPFTFNMNLLQLVDGLHNFTESYKAMVVIKHLDNIFVSSRGEVTSTKLRSERPVWRVETAAKAITWWLQNQTKPIESITTSLLDDQIINDL